MTTTAAYSVEAALGAFRGFMGALQLARARRGDPWAECPMTMPQLRALSLIATAPNGLSSRELASLLGVGASAITPLVDRLADRGFVLRHEDPRDRRIARLTATDDGRDALQRLAAGKGDVLREVLSRLSNEELELVVRAFGVLRTGLEPVEGN
jgi:DNA-binding MarR family transcriptional regulator